MRMFIKSTVGTVTQRFDADTGMCMGQEFECGDECNYETEYGDRIDPPENEIYQPYYMSVRSTENPSSRATLYQMICNLHLRLFGSNNIWEYKVIEKEGPTLARYIQKDLDELGKSGWELAHIEEIGSITWWYLKRRVK